jgi:hypothetical protein
MNSGGCRTIDSLVLGLGQDLRLPRVGLVAQVWPGGVARARGDARGHHGLQQEAERRSQHRQRGKRRRQLEGRP